MFGHQDDQDHHHHDDDQKPMEDVLSDQAADNVLTTDDSGTMGNDDHFNPALPVASDSPFGDAVVSDAPTQDAPAQDTTAPVVAPETDDATTFAPAADGDHGDLLNIKQQALTELSPLVGHLEQTPEEKFRTTMMMIQASDNKDLIKAAYEAAQAITDEKVKAQALLDIVNEINYFTQHAA